MNTTIPQKYANIRATVFIILFVHIMQNKQAARMFVFLMVSGSV